MKDKQKPKDWKITKFLKSKAPELAGDVLNLAGDLTGVELLNKIGDKIDKSDKLTKEDKDLALKYLEMDMLEMQEITKRWQSDNEQDLKLPKLIRPLTLAVLVGLFVLTIILSYFDVLIPDKYLTVLEMILLTVIGAYFGARSVDKYTKNKK